jgi:putative ABC transport system substrate-binding protein
MWLSTIGLLVTFGIGLLWPPLVATAQQPGKVYRIGFLSAGSPPPPSAPAPVPDAFWQQLRELGWVEGQNMVVERRWAERQLERLPALATELVQQKVDLILVRGGLEILAAQQATRTIPIVMMTSLDAVEQGFVASLAHPGGNITGVTTMTAALDQKRLELLKEAVPGSSRMTVLTCKDRGVSEQFLQAFGRAEVTRLLAAAKQDWEEMQVTARALGVQLQRLEVREPDDYEGAFAAAISERAEAMVVIQCYLNAFNWQRVVDLAAKHRLPAIYNARGWVTAGGLMSYGLSLPDLARRAATYVDKILKGAKPADLPVEQPMKFELVLNLTTAKALGLTIPPSILFQADAVMDVATVPVPGPPEVTITPPAADLLPELAAYSGTWEGAWGNALKSRLVVEKIDAEAARVIYAWADHPQGRFKGGWTRVRAQVLPGGRLQWGDKVKFTFEMAQDRMSIAGEREEAGYIATVIMRKVAP